MTVLGWALIGYAAGSFPSAWVVALRAGKLEVLDGVRRTIGETDAHLLLKHAGGRAAAVAAALDVLKGLAAVGAAAQLAGPHEIAACAVAAVAGHCWPMWHYRLAGRGVAAAAGTFLAFLPFEMVVAGLVRVAGGALGAGGLATTLGYVAVPLLAVLRGQPLPYVVASAVINVLIFSRRLEGIAGDVAIGLPWPRALARRIIFDASALGSR